MVGQAPLTLSFYTILTNRNRFTLQPGTPSPTQILLSTRMTSIAPYLTRYIMLLGTFQSLSTDLQSSIILPLIEYTPTTPLPCWNFNKADWERFQAVTIFLCLNPTSTCVFPNFKRESRKLQKTIPRGFRKNYIPKWDTTCDELASRLEEAESPEEKLLSSNRLIDHLNSKRKEEWISTIENVDVKRSSRRAWKTINKLTGHKNVSPNPNSISPNAVASCSTMGSLRTPADSLPERSITN